MAQYKLVKCTINGKAVEKMVDVRASLTDMLRNDFRLTSVKKGCEVGECGACNVLIDGEAVNSCLYLAAWADGKEILTLEGLMNPDGSISLLARHIEFEHPVKHIPISVTAPVPDERLWQELALAAEQSQTPSIND